VLGLKLAMKKEMVRKMHDPGYVSPKPYHFFPNGEDDAEAEKHVHRHHQDKKIHERV